MHLFQLKHLESSGRGENSLLWNKTSGPQQRGVSRNPPLVIDGSLHAFVLEVVEVQELE